MTNTVPISLAGAKNSKAGLERAPLFFCHMTAPVRQVHALIEKKGGGALQPSRDCLHQGVRLEITCWCSLGNDLPSVGHEPTDFLKENRRGW